MKRTIQILKVLWNLTAGSAASLFRGMRKAFVRTYEEDALDHHNITLSIR